MSDEDDGSNTSSTFNLLNFVKTRAEAVKNGASLTTVAGTSNADAPSKIITTTARANLKSTPMMSCRPKSSENFEDHEQHAEVLERPPFSMRFNPMSFTTSQPVSFTKSTTTEEETKDEEEENKEVIPRPSCQPASMKQKLSYSEVEMLNKFSSTNNELPSKSKYGMGAALLKKMGYIEGKGLGKNNQGIVEPIKHDARQAGRGLHVSKKNKDRKRGERNTEDDISEQQEEEESSEDEEGIIRFDSRKKADATPSLYEIIKEMEILGVKIPDGIKELCNDSSSSVRLIELNKEGTNDKIHQIKVDLIQIQNQLTEIVSSIKQSQLKINDLESLKSHVQSNINIGSQISSLLEELQEAINSTDKLSQDERIARIKEIFIRFQALDHNISPASSQDINIEKLLVLSIKPIIVEIFASWDPLDISTTDTLDQIISWKESLPVMVPPSDFSSNSLSYFQSLLYSLWQPKISSVLETWPVDQPNLPITLILDWGEVLHESIINDVMVNTISQNVISAIREWKVNEKREKEGVPSPSSPPYVWIFEWLPFLKLTSEDIKNEFIYKYGSFMDSWNGVDPIEGLDSFKEIVGELQYNVFLEKKAFPKLCYFLTNPSFYRFNSTSFDKSLFQSIVSFDCHIPNLSFEKLLKLGFLANWTKYLQDTLYEVYDWYKVSKTLKNWYLTFKPYFHKYPMIQERYSASLEMVNKFMKGLTLDTIKVLNQHELLSITLNKQKQLVEKPRIQRIDVTFRDVVEDYCFEKGWLFDVAANDLSTGKKLFQIRSGSDKSITLSLESDVIFIKNGMKFTPVSLYSLDSML